MAVAVMVGDPSPPVSFPKAKKHLHMARWDASALRQETRAFQHVSPFSLLFDSRGSAHIFEI